MAGDWFGSGDSVIASRLTSVQPSPIWMIVICGGWATRCETGSVPSALEPAAGLGHRARVSVAGLTLWGGQERRDRDG